MRISNSGDVGINVDNPGSRLAIYDADGHNLTLSSHNWSGEARIGFTGGASNQTGYNSGGTAGAIGVTASAPGGQAVGYMSFYTNQGDDLMEYLRIDKDGHVQLRQDTGDGSNQQKLQWISNNGNLSAQAAWGQGSANFDFSVFRTDSQTDYPYGNFRVLTGHGTSPTEALKVTVGGQVLKARHPFFSGRIYAAAGSSPQTSLYNWTFSTIEINQGSHFNNSTGYFTCPVSGRYAVMVTMNRRNGSSTWSGLYVVKNGTTMSDNWHVPGNANEWSPLSSQMMLDCSASDTISVCYHSSYATPKTSSLANNAAIWLVG